MATDFSRIRQWLAASKIRSSNNALWQAIESLIEQVDVLQTAVNAGTGGSTTTIINTINGTIGPPGADGADGEDGNIGPIGIPGLKGDIGAGGPAGPTTIGPMGIDGMDGEDGYPLPGPQGILGAQGIQGPVGPPTIGPMGMDGQDGEDSYIQLINVIPAEVASADWVLIAQQTAAGANYDFTDLGDYNEIRVVVFATTPSVSTEVIMQVSIDNGATFLTTSGDYINISNVGAPTNVTHLRFYGTASPGARYGHIHIFGFNMTAIKVSLSNIAGITYMMLIPVTSALNAIRVRAQSGVINSGTIYVFGR